MRYRLALTLGASLFALSGCSTGTQIPVDRKDRPVVGTLTARAYVEYGSEWADRRWQSTIERATAKMVLPIGSSSVRVLAPDQEAYRAAHTTDSTEHEGYSRAGAIKGATSANRPRSGHTTADRATAQGTSHIVSGQGSVNVMASGGSTITAKHIARTRTFGDQAITRVAASRMESSVRRPQLSIELGLTPDYLAPGDEGQLLVRLKNVSNEAAVEPEVVVYLPAGTRFAGLDGAAVPDEDLTDSWIELKLPDGLAAGAEHEITIDLELAAAGMRVAEVE